MHFPSFFRRNLLLSSLLIALPINTATPVALPQLLDWYPGDNGLGVLPDSHTLESDPTDNLILVSAPEPSDSLFDSWAEDSTDLFGGESLNLGAFQMASHPLPDDPTIYVGDGIDPGRWWEGNQENTNIFIHCCDDIEAELQVGCIRHPNCVDSGAGDTIPEAVPPPQTPLEAVGDAAAATAGAVIWFGKEVWTGAGHLWNTFQWMNQ